MTAAAIPNKSPSGSRSSVQARLFAVASWLQLLAFVALGGFALLSAARYGHWPYYAAPDPKQLHLPVFHAAALFAIPMALITLPFCAMLVFLGWDSLKRRDILVFATGAVGWALIFPTLGQLFEWLID